MGRTDLRLAMVAATAFVVLAVLVATGWSPLIELDTWVSKNANAFSADRPDLVRAMKVWTTAAGPLTWRLLLLAAGALLVVRRKGPAAAFVICTVVAGGLLSTALKVGVDRTRPVVPHPFANAVGMSFPSGHAGTAVLASGAMVVLLAPVLAARPPALRMLVWTVAVLLPLSVGLTRIGLDVHWTSDVVGGWLLGVAVVAAAHAAFRPNDPPAPAGRPWRGVPGAAGRPPRRTGQPDRLAD